MLSGLHKNIIFPTLDKNYEMERLSSIIYIMLSESELTDHKDIISLREIELLGGKAC